MDAATPRGAAQRRLARHLAEAGLDGAALDARLLLCAALGTDHAGLVRDPDLPLGPAAADRLSHFAARRLRREPVARILGRREFWGLPFTLTPDVLDPRADTETVVEAVLETLGSQRHAALRVLDLGTGSGALLGALLHACPNAFGVGVDVSCAACITAHGNLERLDLGGRGSIVQASWSAALRGPFDVVVANPPYVATADIAGLDPDVAGYDPALALDGGSDGLAPYRIIVPALPSLLAARGIAALEGGWNQGVAISAMMEAAGLLEVVLRQDLAGHGRVAVGRGAG